MSSIKKTKARDPVWLQWLLIGTAMGFVTVFLLLPLAVVFFEALRGGIGAYLKGFQDRAAWQAIRLTIIATSISLPLNLVFGVAAAWAIAKFEFKGKSILLTLIDLPFAV